MALGTNYTVADVMNAIRQEASPTYQDRIPALNQNNFEEFAQGMNVPAMFNEWFNALINRIGLTVLKTRAWKNPLAPIKKGELKMGETIQEIFIDLIEAQDWKKFTTENDAGKIFKTEKPDVAAAYFKINRTDMYPVSYNEVDIRRAFINEGTLERFIGDLYERLHTSDELDEYLYMKELLKTYDDRGLYHYVSVPALENLDLNIFISQVKAMSTKFKFISDKYTALEVPQHAPIDNQVIYISADLDAIIDVNVLASAFNMDKKEFLARKVVLDEMPVDGALLILASKDWLNVYDSVRRIEMLPNPYTLEMKLFYHVHQVLYTSLFENAVVFTTTQYKEPATVELTGAGVTGTQVTAPKGQFFTLTASVKDSEDSATDVIQTVTYKLGEKAHPQTRIEGNRLYVDLQQDETFELMVSAIHNPDVSETYTVKFA